MGSILKLNILITLKMLKIQKNIIYMIADTIYNMKRAGVIDLKILILANQDKKKCSSGCK